MVELAIWDEFLSEGKELPSSWDEIPSFRDIKKRISTQNLDTLRHINALAIVEKSPTIQAGEGISLSHSGRKLFAISRTAEFHSPKSKSNNESSQRGRYAILVAADGNKTESSWIPESEVQLILKQIKNFDSDNQPIAFENVDQLERDKQAQQDQYAEDIKEQSRKTGKPGSAVQITPDAQYTKQRELRNLAWISGCFVAAFLVWIAWRIRSPR